MRKQTNRTESFTETFEVIFDRHLAEAVRNRSLLENRSIDEIIQVAILRYLQGDVGNSDIRMNAANCFSSHPLNITRKEFDSLLHTEYFDQ